MSNAKNMKELTKEILNSYELRILAVSTIVDNTHRMLDEFSEKRSVMSMQLKKTLARDKSFREKDFDRMMTDVLGPQDKMENDTRILLNLYLDEQKNAAKTIRETLRKHMACLFLGHPDGINDFRSGITGIQASQRTSEEMHDMELRDMLKTIYRKHKMTIEFLQSFLEEGIDDRIQSPGIMVKNRSIHSEGWWEVFKQTVSQWRELIDMERQNMFMAQQRIFTTSPMIMLDYFKQMDETGS